MIAHTVCVHLYVDRVLFEHPFNNNSHLSTRKIMSSLLTLMQNTYHTVMPYLISFQPQTFKLHISILCACNAGACTKAEKGKF